MSFNVRMDTDQDGDNRWDNRKEVVAEIIRKNRPLAFGLQVGGFACSTASAAASMLVLQQRTMVGTIQTGLPSQ